MTTDTPSLGDQLRRLAHRVEDAEAEAAASRHTNSQLRESLRRAEYRLKVLRFGDLVTVERLAEAVKHAHDTGQITSGDVARVALGWLNGEVG